MIALNSPSLRDLKWQVIDGSLKHPLEASFPKSKAQIVLSLPSNAWKKNKKKRRHIQNDGCAVTVLKHRKSSAFEQGNTNY